MDIFLDPESGKPLAGQLYEQLRRAITSGRLLAGDQLVPSRQLAGELGVSRHTVTTAYGRLVAEGYAEGHAGGGSVVESASPPPPKGASAAAALRPGRRFAGWSPYFRPPPYGCRFDLRPGLADPALFPAEMWRRRVAAAVAAGRAAHSGPHSRLPDPNQAE
jgi:GntR family transcriptional regulator / MocR family aminotransferase